MKVTDELWSAYVRACHERGLLFLPATVENEVRDALQAALADEHPEGVALECFREEHRARERAEAKLASVEQLAKEWDERASDAERFREENPPINHASMLIAGAVLSIGDAFQQCARELRERLEGEP